MSDFTPNRQPRGVPTGGQFAASAKSEAGVALNGLPDPDPVADQIPRTPDGNIDVPAAVRGGHIEGFSETRFEAPKTFSLHGHWDGNTLVVETILDGEVLDDRPDNGHWDGGLWADSATGSSEAEIAATLIDQTEDCERMRVAVTEDDMTPEEFDEECVACEAAGRTPDPDFHDSQNCWQEH